MSPYTLMFEEWMTPLNKGIYCKKPACRVTSQTILWRMQLEGRLTKVLVTASTQDSVTKHRDESWPICGLSKWPLLHGLRKFGLRLQTVFDTPYSWTCNCRDWLGPLRALQETLHCKNMASNHFESRQTDVTVVFNGTVRTQFKQQEFEKHA